MLYDQRRHSSRHTDAFVFSQLILYIGNKRKLLGLIEQAITATELEADRSRFFDFFSGSGVVSRFAKTMGFRVLANDWVASYLCPRDDDASNASEGRMFFMRKNGMRIDAIRHALELWQSSQGRLQLHA